MSTQNVTVARFAHNVKWDFFCDFQTPTYLLCIPWEYLSVIILKQDIYFGQDLERENEQNYIKQEWKHFSDHRSKLPHSNTATSVSKTTSSPAKLDFCPAFLFFCGVVTEKDRCTVFENHRKSLIQHLRLHFEWT